jgi:hypothetical protein
MNMYQIGIKDENSKLLYVSQIMASNNKEVVELAE